MIGVTHKSVSFTKSFLRIIAGVSLILVMFTLKSDWIGIAGIFFILAEVLGIIEELV